MPAWKADGTPTTDPQAELFGTSTTPAVRGWRIDRAHPLGKIPRFPRCRAPRTSWGCPSARSAAGRLRLGFDLGEHVFFPRSRETHAFFGLTEHELVLRPPPVRVAEEKSLLTTSRLLDSTASSLSAWLPKKLSAAVEATRLLGKWTKLAQGHLYSARAVPAAWDSQTCASRTSSRRSSST